MKYLITSWGYDCIVDEVLWVIVFSLIARHMFWSPIFTAVRAWNHLCCRLATCLLAIREWKYLIIKLPCPSLCKKASNHHANLPLEMYISRGRLAWWLLAFLCCAWLWYHCISQLYEGDLEYIWHLHVNGAKFLIVIYYIFGFTLIECLYHILSPVKHLFSSYMLRFYKFCFRFKSSPPQ